MSTNASTASLEAIFEKLDEWRDLPGFRLEPHVAPFFGIFMEDILNAHLNKSNGEGIQSTVIPEFPLRKGEFEENDADDNQSNHVDYLAISKDKKTAYFVELKTDLNSIRDKQLQYLKDAKKVPFRQFVCGIFEITTKAKSKRRRKYIHLLHQMKELGLVSSLDKLYIKAFTTKNKSLGKFETLLNCAKKQISSDVPKCTKVAFILPKRDDNNANKASTWCADHIIDFKCVANVVKKSKSNSELGHVFAEYLYRWSERDAGFRDPMSKAKS